MKYKRFSKSSVKVVRKISILRPVAVVLLILGVFLAVWTSFPLMPEPVANASAAVPAPTPDQKEIDALVDQLKGLLAETIEDEETVNAIVERWDQLKLLRKRKKQIINLLFAEVQSVVRDKKISDTVWASWSDAIAEADAEEPADPFAGLPEGASGKFVNGRYVISDEKRRAKGTGNMLAFTQEYQKVKVWKPEKRQYRGLSYTVYTSTSPIDPDAEAKIAGADNAVRAVADAGFALPYDLRFYCSSVDRTPTVAFQRDQNFAPIAYIILGPGGSDKALSTTAAGFNGYDTRTIRTIHEIGHIIHERQAGDYFWQTPANGANPAIAAKVSVYASQGSFKEFVAEVFAGLIIGKRWPNDVLAEYYKHSGPVLAAF